jgi:hypothetical protein
MHKAGRHLCVQAPKEDRKVFSTTDQADNQVSGCKTQISNLHTLLYTMMSMILFHIIFLEP